MSNNCFQTCKELKYNEHFGIEIYFCVLIADHNKRNSTTLESYVHSLKLQIYQAYTVNNFYIRLISGAQCKILGKLNKKK